MIRFDMKAAQNPKFARLFFERDSLLVKAGE